MSKEVVDYVEKRGQLLHHLNYNPERVIKILVSGTENNAGGEMR